MDDERLGASLHAEADTTHDDAEDFAEGALGEREVEQRLSGDAVCADNGQGAHAREGASFAHERAEDGLGARLLGLD